MQRKSMPYPRRKLMRLILKWLSAVAFKLVSDLRVEGTENLPSSGPVILAGNHFHFADPVALLHICDRQVEFVGGFRFPNAPAIVKFLPSLWGYLPVHRGGYSRQSLEMASKVLEQGGVLGIFPEGGAWAQTLRPPRSGVGFLATRNETVIVPVALEGFHRLFKERRPKLLIRIGKPLGPFNQFQESGSHQKAYRAVGNSVMEAIAEMLPEDARGVYSKNEAVREQAMRSAEYPFERDEFRGM